MFAMGHRKSSLRNSVTDNRTIKKTPKPQHNYDMKQCELCAVIHTTVRNRPKSKPSFGDLHLPSRAASYPATVNGKACANYELISRYELKCCRFKLHVLWQDNRTLIGSRLDSS